MTIRYGTYVGTPKAAFPAALVDKAYERTKMDVLVRDTIVLAAAAIGDQIYAQQLGWEAIVDPYDSFVSYAALGAGTTISFGDATFPAALDAAFSTAAAGQHQLLSAQSIGSYFVPLWQALGYASLKAAQAVGPQAVLYFTIAGAAATGVVTWRLMGERRD